MTTIILHGKLGKLFGYRLKASVKSPAEAIRAVEANNEGFYAHLIESSRNGIEYRVITNGKDFKNEDELSFPRRCETIEIVPVPSGAANTGLWTTIIGVALVIVGVVTFIYGGGWLVSVGSLMISVGLSLTFAGLSQMLAKNDNLNAPKNTMRLSDTDKYGDARRTSYLFSGVVNTARQGNAVPMGYGQMLVGSQVISVGVSSWNLPLTDNEPIVPPEELEDEEKWPLWRKLQTLVA